ncbi:Wadjet anti-phage system protein JetD domain-containing protein [Alicyclobacillus sp. SO9]|uniref:Wadjet anti-phage system protein JetD domain-containing protein n=1 Tax=Alicyclobacillus sp. SO9 TaxID=2665646 RepID=UPI0018E8FA00|nr:Wadjet anti-phage system protein JetD domain-containing protein [Alicyclobacillus sp. SO9]QQE80529.1 hypothetical protein GI364_09035 [Alicyclobacillus sp. SO9]
MQGETLARRVLSRLLDKYESSEAFRKGKPTQTRIQLKLTDSIVAGYVTGRLDPDDREALHESLRTMAERRLIALKWVKFEQGNILERVYLKWERIGAAYEYLSRVPQREKLAEFTTEMEEWLKRLLNAGLPERWYFLSNWVDDILSFVRQRGRIPSSLIPEEDHSRTLLLRALVGLVRKRDTSVPVRLFSKQQLGNSKIFEKQVQSSVVRLMRRYWSVVHPLEFEAPDDDATLLRELGIESGHEDITFCGPIRFQYITSEGTATAGEIDAAVFPYGLAVDASDVHRIQITEASISRILTIENKANYRAYVRDSREPGEFVIYLGGFASPAQRAFLRLLRSFLRAPTADERVSNTSGQVSRVLPENSASTSELNRRPRVALYHWGDLDYGGILILQNLRNSCWPEAQPWRMEPRLLDDYIEYAEQIDEPYRAKLRRLLDSDGYLWAHPLVQRILLRGATLEQEALLLGE